MGADLSVLINFADSLVGGYSLSLSANQGNG